MHETSLYTTSVCTGSLLLGAAGLLKGLEATTHWSAYELLSSFGAHPVSSRVVHQVHMITSTASNSWFLRRNYVHQVHMITSTAMNLWFLRRNYTCDISFLSVRQIFFWQNRSKVHLRFRMWGPLYTVYKWPWPMKLWKPLNLVRRPYRGDLKLVFLWSWTLRCRVKTYMTGPSTKWYFIIIPSNLYNKLWSKFKGCEILIVVVSQLYVRLGSKR